MDYIPVPLLLKAEYLLRRGEDYKPGQAIKKAMRPKAQVCHRRDLEDRWDGTYTYQSTLGTLRRIIYSAKNQGVWCADRTYDELMDARNVGGARLRCESDERATFDRLWAEAYYHGPKATTEQMTAGLASHLAEAPGARLVEVRAVAAEQYGWRKKREIDGLLNGLVAFGVLLDERHRSATGSVRKRQFWLATEQLPAALGKVVRRAVGLALRALDCTHGLGHGHAAMRLQHAPAESHAPLPGPQSHRFSRRDRSYQKLIGTALGVSQGARCLRAELAMRAARGRLPSRPPSPQPLLAADGLIGIGAELRWEGLDWAGPTDARRPARPALRRSRRRLRSLAPWELAALTDGLDGLEDRTPVCGAGLGQDSGGARSPDRVAPMPSTWLEVDVAAFAAEPDPWMEQVLAELPRSWQRRDPTSFDLLLAHDGGRPLTLAEVIEIKERAEGAAVAHGARGSGRIDGSLGGDGRSGSSISDGV